MESSGALNPNRDFNIITPYIGKYEQSSIFLNNGKYGPYLNYKD